MTSFSFNFSLQNNDNGGSSIHLSDNSESKISVCETKCCMQIKCLSIPESLMYFPIGIGGLLTIQKDPIAVDDTVVDIIPGVYEGNFYLI